MGQELVRTSLKPLMTDDCSESKVGEEDEAHEDRLKEVILDGMVGRESTVTG